MKYGSASGGPAAESAAGSAGPRYLVGLDLGDGESAIAWVDTHEPQRIRLYSRGNDEISVVTAIARTRNSGYVIGEAALREPEATQVRINFKSQPYRTGVGLVAGPLDIVEFARAYVIEFTERYPEIAADCMVYVGHPAGWPSAAVDAYRDQLEFALRPLEIRLIPEAQSAFLHVHDEDGVALDTRPVLVVDIGSSTTDITLITDRAENLPYGESLGCRLIDEQICTRVTERLALKDAENLRTGVSYANGLSWLARRHKEAAFAGVPSPPPTVSPRSATQWVIDTCWPALQKVSVRDLATGPGGWDHLFRAELERVRDHLGRTTPALILTTGGGSRMPFVSQVCAEVFPHAIVDPAAEPSLAVARGLASYGRWRHRVENFRRGVGELTKSDAIDAVMAAEARPLAERLYKAWITWSLALTATEYNEVLSGTRMANDSSDLETRQRRFVHWLTTPDGIPTRNEIFGRLEAKLNAALTPDSQALCRNCGLADNALDTKVVLPPDVFVRIRPAILRDLDRNLDRLGGAVWAMMERSSLIRWYLRASDRLFGFLEPGLSDLTNKIAAPLYGLSADDVAELDAAIRTRLRDDLLERARGIESLLA